MYFFDSRESSQESRNLERILPLLSERKRRTYLRKLERGEEIDIPAEKDIGDSDDESEDENTDADETSDE